MTRMWYGVDPEELCDQHLYGEHAEMHQEVGTIRGHPHGLAVAEGHADEGQVDTARLQSRHDKLAAEIKRRGGNHESPMDYDDDLDIGGDQLDAAANRTDLYQRCLDCADRMGTHQSQPDRSERADLGGGESTGVQNL